MILLDTDIDDLYLFLPVDNLWTTIQSEREKEVPNVVSLRGLSQTAVLLFIRHLVWLAVSVLYTYLEQCTLQCTEYYTLKWVDGFENSRHIANRPT